MEEIKERNKSEMQRIRDLKSITTLEGSNDVGLVEFVLGIRMQELMHSDASTCDKFINMYGKVIFN